MVPRAGGCAYDFGVWDLSIVQGTLSVAPWQTLEMIRDAFIAERASLVAGGSTQARGCRGRRTLRAASPSTEVFTPNSTCQKSCTCHQWGWVSVVLQREVGMARVRLTMAWCVV